MNSLAELTIVTIFINFMVILTIFYLLSDTIKRVNLVKTYCVPLYGCGIWIVAMITVWMFYGTIRFAKFVVAAAGVSVLLCISADSARLFYVSYRIDQRKKIMFRKKY